MAEGKAIERLMGFGLTRQEAVIYECLLRARKLTGYEAAKLTGISRSNAYGSLANLIEKGAAYSEDEENVRKYIPVHLVEFCDNYIGKIKRDSKWLATNIISAKAEEEGYITIEGKEHILNKIRNLLRQVEERVYISGSKTSLAEIIQDINELVKANKKVVIITDEPVSIVGVKVYVGNNRKNQIGVIADSKYVLTGEYGREGNNTCLYSGQKNFVELYKNALSNEIKLIRYEGRSTMR